MILNDIFVFIFLAILRHNFVYRDFAFLPAAECLPLVADKVSPTERSNEEEMMTGMKGLALVTMMVSCVAFAPGAYANEGSPATCFHLAQQVTDALSKAPSDQQTTEEAKKMARNARGFCSVQMYDRGTMLYEKALTLLGKR